jgi:DNA-directed RNA polymerase specialized sigma24 family protein
MDLTEIMRISRWAAFLRVHRYWWVDARDAEQEAFAAVWGALGGHDPDRSPVGAYACTVAVRAVDRWLLDHVGPVRQTHRTPSRLRHAELHRDMQSQAPPADGVAAAREGLLRSARVLAPHPLGARVLAGDRPREVARELGVHVRAVYNDTFRARRALRRLEGP